MTAAVHHTKIAESLRRKDAAARAAEESNPVASAKKYASEAVTHTKSAKLEGVRLSQKAAKLTDEASDAKGHDRASYAHKEAANRHSMAARRSYGSEREAHERAEELHRKAEKYHSAASGA